MSYDGREFSVLGSCSGTRVIGHLSNATLNGSKWLSGGAWFREAQLFNLVERSRCW